MRHHVYLARQSAQTHYIGLSNLRIFIEIRDLQSQVKMTLVSILKAPQFITDKSINRIPNSNKHFRDENTPVDLIDLWEVIKHRYTFGTCLYGPS